MQVVSAQSVDFAKGCMDVAQPRHNIHGISLFKKLQPSRQWAPDTVPLMGRQRAAANRICAQSWHLAAPSMLDANFLAPWTPTLRGART
mmetsp:Transcript_120526/g.221689  ORF Transcript_120526/g.221689 Transcript_120526/m.221689 type:complete len:89 (+) Transcript_120526:53-319(+)